MLKPIIAYLRTFNHVMLNGYSNNESVTVSLTDNAITLSSKVKTITIELTDKVSIDEHGNLILSDGNIIISFYDNTTKINLLNVYKQLFDSVGSISNLQSLTLPEFKALIAHEVMHGIAAHEVTRKTETSSTPIVVDDVNELLSNSKTKLTRKEKYKRLAQFIMANPHIVLRTEDDELTAWCVEERSGINIECSSSYITKRDKIKIKGNTISVIKENSTHVREYTVHNPLTDNTDICNLFK